MTQAELGDRARLSESMVGRLEAGERGASPSSLKRLARALGCEPWDIAEIAEKAS